MSKFNSRKLWAWITWNILMVVITIFAREDLSIAIPWYGAVTIIYIFGQGSIDFIKAWKGGGDA